MKKDLIQQPPSEIEKELFNRVRASINGTITYIKNPIERLSEYYNFYPEQYTLIGSIPGVGKTSFVDFNLLSILDNLPKDLHVEVLYYSMERKKRFKYAKWLSWKMFDRDGKRTSSDTILNKHSDMTEGQLDYLQKEFGEWLEGILSHIDLREGSRTAAQIRYDIDKLAKKLGVYYWSDDTNIYRFDTPIGTFTEALYINTKHGKRYYIVLKVEGANKEIIEHILYQNDRVFLTAKPTLVFIVHDHVGKTKRVPGSTKKDTLDELDEVYVDARDMYSFSPIPISQFNRAISSTDRIKHSKNDLDPILEDFKDTGNMTESADLVLSIFEPGRYKSWDVEGNYKGYNIRDSMVTPKTGIHRARSLHILKNTNGINNKVQVLRTTLESMYFEAMPLPENESALQVIYNEILQGK